MIKLKPFLTFLYNKIFKSQFFLYWIIATTIVLVIIYNVDVKFFSEGGRAAPAKGEFGDKGIVGELETEITSDNKYQGIEGDVSSKNYSKKKNIFISELDNDGLVGYANSIGISKNGFPIISYHHLNAGDLKLAYCENIDCSSAKIHLLDWAGDFGYFTDIAVANSGKVYISYLDRKNGDLRVIRCLDHKCGRAQINVLDKGTGKAGYVGEYNSIDITKQGHPVVGYFDNNFNDLKLAVCEDTDCDKSVIKQVDTDGMVGEYLDLSLDNETDTPIMAYQDRTNQQVKLIQCSDLYCENYESTVIDDVAKRGGDISIFQDKLNTLYISYYDFTLNYLKLAICKDSNCKENKTIVKLVEAKILPGIFYSWNSLIVNNSGNVLISFYDMNSNNFGLVYCDDEICEDKEIINIDKIGKIGTYASMISDSEGRIFISYYDSSRGSLKVAQCENNKCN